MVDTPDSPVIHTITSNDSLAGLSDHFYGTPLLADLIQEKNEKEKNIKLDPKKLPQGASLRIPGTSKNPDQQYWLQQVNLIFRNRNIFHVNFQFQGIDEVLAPSPILVPLMPSESVFGTEITLSVEGLCYQLEGGTQKVFENDDFSFEWKQDPAKAQKPSDLNAKITIKAKNLWKMGDDERAELRTNFDNFCSEIEKQELKGLIIPGGTALVTPLVAESLPATLDETLLFRYGFNKGIGSDSTPYVDLLPGMRLRLESSASQYIELGSKMNGPVASGQFFYTLGRNPDQQITFDAFLDSISAPDTPFAPPTWNVAGSLLGLHRPGAARRHYRLFYPSQTKNPDSSGDARATNEITLIGADTLEDLKTATQSFTTSGELGKAKPGNKPIIAFTLRGWALVVPEIEVFITRRIGRQVDQLTRYVPLGMTVRQVVDNMFPVWHPNILLVGGGQPVRVMRLFSLANGIPEYRLIEFRLSSGIDYEPGLFDLPLAMGDHLEIRLTTP